MPIIIDGMGSAAGVYVVRTKDCIVKFANYLSCSLLITYQTYLTLTYALIGYPLLNYVHLSSTSSYHAAC